MMKKQFSAGIVVYRKDNENIKYLLLHYPGGHWDFPKGKIEEGEDVEQTARRELKEETGIVNVKILPAYHDYVEYFFRIDNEIYYKYVTFFLGKVEHDAVVLSHEHQGYEWLGYKQALERITYQNAKDLLKRAHSFLATDNEL